MTYNQYFSALLSWDDSNLSGLIQYLNRQEDRMAAADGGDHATLLIHRAARRFIARAQQHEGRGPPSVYRAIAGRA